MTQRHRGRRSPCGVDRYLGDVILPRRRVGAGLLLALLVSASACSRVRITQAEPAEPAGSAESMEPVEPAITVADEMRTVPTVAEVSTTLPPLAEGESPQPEIVGDPQPDPDSPDTLPPLPETPTVGACARLEGVGAADVIGNAIGRPVSIDSIDEEGCRFGAAGVTVEVHYVSEATIEGDWFLRDGIEPVGAVTSDAVGLSGFVPPGSSPADGYTIALLSRRQGAVVAVRGTSDDRALAEQVASVVDLTT